MSVYKEFIGFSHIPLDEAFQSIYGASAQKTQAVSITLFSGFIYPMERHQIIVCYAMPT